VQGFFLDLDILSFLDQFFFFLFETILDFS